MNKKLFLSALASTALLASCVENDLGSNENIAGNGNGDGRIGFNYKVGNMTRATELAQDAGHYEFGVYAFKGDTKGEKADDKVMDNYLVAYGLNSLYTLLTDDASTYDTSAGGNYTDIQDQVSTWFYEGLGDGSTTSDDGITWENTTYTIPDNNQILKYWNKDKAVHDFYAYMPYVTAKTTGSTNPQQIVYNHVDPSLTDNSLEFKHLSAFTTSKDNADASDYQYTDANTVPAKTIAPSNATNYNKEMLNYNEALYASNSVAKADYGKDVELVFKHINAKINIKFYEDIKGYNVHIIDLVPASTPGPGGSDLTEAKGIQFSPATLGQSEMKMTQKQPAGLPTFNSYADVKVQWLNTTSPREELKVRGGDGKTNTANLKFEPTTGNIGINRANATASATTLYTLPKWGPNPTTGVPQFITEPQAASTEYYHLNSAGVSTPTTSTYVGDITGYTLHVSYEMIPQDGSSTITVYDARVHVAAEYCKWEAGKAYTYIFKITDRANGVTDPKTVDPGATGTEPWIDPEDPRVPDDPALTPIVFDGVTVTNYDDANTGKENDVDEWVISDPDSWTFFMNSSVKTYYDNSGVYGSAAVADILKRFNIAASPITSVQWNGTAFNVQLNDGGSTPTVFKASSYTAETKSYTDWATALGANLTFASSVSANVKAVLTGDPTTEITVNKPTFNVWTTETTALPYVTTVNAIELEAYDVKYLVTTEFTTGGVTYELGKYISDTTYGSLTDSEKANVTISAKFKPTVTYQTATNITPGTAATAKSAYLIVTKK